MQVVSQAIVVLIGYRYSEDQWLQRTRLPRGAWHFCPRQRGEALLTAVARQH